VRRVLHVGCGQKRKEHLPAPFRSDDWEEVRLDINPAVKPDIVADITDLSVIGDGEMDALFSSHNIEHLFAHQVPVALAEFARVLRTGSGLAVITCPDIQSVGQAIAEGRVTEPLYTSKAGPIAALDILYGHRASVRKGEHYMAHRVGFTGRLLVNSLEGAGFEASTGWRQRRHFALWAIGFRWRATEEERAAHRRAYFPM
jgi:hypothetical protein